MVHKNPQKVWRSLFRDYIHCHPKGSLPKMDNLIAPQLCFCTQKFRTLAGPPREYIVSSQTPKRLEHLEPYNGNLHITSLVLDLKCEKQPCAWSNWRISALGFKLQAENISVGFWKTWGWLIYSIYSIQRRWNMLLYYPLFLLSSYRHGHAGKLRPPLKTTWDFFWNLQIFIRWHSRHPFFWFKFGTPLVPMNSFPW